ncbi:MAG: voltage-gated chloride channel protein [Ilumatobacter sp.]|nr:MAG: voltage-gated chloride channel protein [Ilumatobacter sp.]
MRWIVFGSVVGVLAGLSSAAFLTSLDWATATRQEHPWVLWLLPLAGFAMGLAYWRLGGTSERGNNLVIDEIHEPTAWLPRRMAPLVFVATVVTNLFGGSAGREGTALQMSASLSDGVFRRVIPIGAPDRRVLLIAAISGGFGAVFGVPVAGAVFGLEVHSRGRIRHDAIVPALTASFVGDRIVHLLDVPHLPTPVIGVVDLDIGLLAKVAIASVAFAWAAIAFIVLTHAVKDVLARFVEWSPLRPLIGGTVVVLMTLAIGTRDYLGLSLPLIEDALAGGVGLATFAFAGKMVFTAVTLGSGFQGGEVTPLFVVGSTLGATLAVAMDAPVPLFAALGFVAVFAAATKTPIACMIMGVELFGVGPIVPVMIACTLAYALSTHRSIYTSQRDG